MLPVLMPVRRPCCIVAVLHLQADRRQACAISARQHGRVGRHRYAFWRYKGNHGLLIQYNERRDDGRPYPLPHTDAVKQQVQRHRRGTMKLSPALRQQCMGRARETRSALVYILMNLCTMHVKERGMIKLQTL